MKTYCFVGSNKNAGKTTAFQYVSRMLAQQNHRLTLSSIGINDISKPSVLFKKGMRIVTTPTHLAKHHGIVRILEVFGPPKFGKRYVYVEALQDLHLILEGPNSKSEVLSLKQALFKHQNVDYLLIDGAIDRLFLADPRISDGFFFSLLVSDQKEQRRRIELILKAFEYSKIEDNHPLCDLDLANYKSIVFEDSKILYCSESPGFMDVSLHKVLQTTSQKKGQIYLNGAFTDVLANLCVGLNRVILNNFTQLQTAKFSGSLMFLHHPKVIRFFVRNMSSQEFKLDNSTDLFREDFYAL